MITVRCKVCRRELTGQLGKTQCCGCSNMMTVTEDKVTARDLGQVIMVASTQVSKKKDVLSPQDIAWQEERRKRKVRKLDFEIK
jgi:hypothetical protein